VTIYNVCTCYKLGSSHSDADEDLNPLACEAVLLDDWIPMFQSNVVSETSRTIHPSIMHPRQAESPVYIPFGQTYKLVWISHKYLLLQLVHVSYYTLELLYRQAELLCSWVQENLVTASIKIAHTTAVFSSMATSALLWAFIMSQSSLVSDGGGLWISEHVRSMSWEKKLKCIVNNIQC